MSITIKEDVFFFFFFFDLRNMLMFVVVDANILYVGRNGFMSFMIIIRLENVGQRCTMKAFFP